MAIGPRITPEQKTREGVMEITQMLVDSVKESLSAEKRNIQVSKEENKAKDKNVSIEFLPVEPKYSLSELIVPKHVREKILDVAEYAENSKIVFDKWGLSETHKQSKRVGINLYGPPGTGKTMAAHAIAHNLGRKIILVNYADIESKYVGDTPKNIRKAFETAKATDSILFFDEADAILSRRVTNMSSSTDVSVNQTRSVMLMILNEYQDFVIFATNFIENFDPAFMRRISMHVQFELPDVECRKLLWRKYIPELMPTDVDIDIIAERYDCITGSDISTAVLNAAFKAARSKSDMVRTEDMYSAIEDIIVSKNANDKKDSKVKVVTEEVTEEYALRKINEMNESEEK